MNTIFHVQFPGLGLEFTIDRVALSLGGFNIYWYGVVIALGLLLGMVWAFAARRIMASTATALSMLL